VVSAAFTAHRGHLSSDLEDEDTQSSGLQFRTTLPKAVFFQLVWATPRAEIEKGPSPWLDALGISLVLARAVTQEVRELALLKSHKGEGEKKEGSTWSQNCSMGSPKTTNQIPG